MMRDVYMRDDTSCICVAFGFVDIGVFVYEN